jgi:hypothetical protein
MIQTEDDDISYGTARSSLTDGVAGISLEDSSVHSNASNSTFSSMQGIIEAETEKKRGFTTRIRERLVKTVEGNNITSVITKTRSINMDGLEKEGNAPTIIVDGGETSSQCYHHNSDMRKFDSRSLSGIMTVRTLDESLRGGSLSDMRRLRRRVSIRFKSFNGDADPSCKSFGDSSLSLDDDSSAYSSTSHKISLGFHKVIIREYEVVPGCNPSVSCGPPVELGWKHGDHREIDLDKYESVREGRRRYKLQMRMPKEVRKNLLLLHGSTKKMIKEASKNAKRGR